MVNSPLVRPYFLGGGVPLGSHDVKDSHPTSRAKFGLLHLYCRHKPDLPWSWICFVGNFDLSTMVNHHYTTIWENLFGTFSRHRRVTNPSDPTLTKLWGVHDWLATTSFSHCCTDVREHLFLLGMDVMDVVIRSVGAYMIVILLNQLLPRGCIGAWLPSKETITWIPKMMVWKRFGIYLRFQFVFQVNYSNYQTLYIEGFFK